MIDLEESFRSFFSYDLLEYSSDAVRIFTLRSRLKARLQDIGRDAHGPVRYA